MNDIITEPGIYDVAESDYYSNTRVHPRLGRVMSYSAAKVLLDSPARYAACGTNLDSDSADLGTLVHALVLRTGDTRIRVYDAYDWRSKAHQAAKRADREQGLVPVHRGDLLRASRIAAAVRRHPLASALLSEGTPEQTLYWVDAETGVACRARIDMARDDVLVDLKTVSAGFARVGAFGRRCAQFDYPMQAATYVEGWHAITGRTLPLVFIAVETEPPYLVIVGYPPAWAIDAGRDRWHAALAEFARRESDDDWPTSDYPDTFVEFDVPAYYGRTAS